ncbi:MAG TPA: hypothetical protein VFF68_11895 [Anaerolineaceae bacterium]|nr:hypothetical protein [Anaerolineaceae bacterium]
MNPSKLHVEIVLKECLDGRLAEGFAGFDLTATPAGATLLTGDVPDQPALHGLLERIRDFNLSLVSVRVEEIKHG